MIRLMRCVLRKEFFDRPALQVARGLLGKYLVRTYRGKRHAYRIIETEAYFGYADRGSHAHCGQTRRNAPMFAHAGTIYVYFTYGMHWMLNIVCGKAGFPAAVLIRGVSDEDARYDGPGKLTRALHIDKRLNTRPLGKPGGLWIEDRGIRVRARDIARTPRIGIPNRGTWTEKPWRFVLRESASTER